MPKIRCSHCQLEYAPNDVFKCAGTNGEELYFCCSGCESVYKLLHDNELSSFYDKITAPLTPPKESHSQFHEDLRLRFDSEGFRRKYIQKVYLQTKDSKQEYEYSKVNLIIEKIHCAACIWLIEKILLQQDSIMNVHINYTNNKATIVWDHNTLPLSAIIALIQAVGYDAHVYDSRVQENTEKAQMKEYYTRVIVALFCTMNIMWIAIAQYSGYFLGIDEGAKDILNIASFVLCVPTLFYSGFVFYRGSYYGLKNGFVGMDLLVAVGSTLTFIYSVYAALTRSGETYFESVSMIITFVLIGKFLEVRARKNAGDSLDRLGHLLPTNVEVETENGVKSISPEEVEVGDIIIVRAGEKIAIDGVLLSPRAVFDTQAISGESVPLECVSGQNVLSGYVNCNHQIRYQASKIFSQSLMSHIVEIVSSSFAHRPHIQNLANTLSQYFSRVILTIALLCFGLWLWWGNVGVEHALMIAISVIIIACPCALALATPIASVVGIGESYRHNVLFKQAQFLESLAKARMVVFDKTGTLTLGKPQVRHLHKCGEFDYMLLLQFVKQSKHPVAQGVANYLESTIVHSPTHADMRDFCEIDSMGIVARIGNEEIELVGGSLNFLLSKGFVLPNIELGNGMLFGFGTRKGEVYTLLGVFELYDELKPHAQSLIGALQKRGITCVLLSGDREQSVTRVAKEVGIDRALAALDPLQKAQWIESYKQQNPQNIVVMIGDGINDAPALSKSDIAISMGAGSDIAILSSDIVILDDKLSTLHNAFEIAYRTYKGIKQNIALSIGYNALSIPLACAGFIIPLFAALSMSFSSLLVVLNSMRLKTFKGVKD